MAQLLERFVDRESWLVGRELKEHAAWFPEVDRTEILAVEHWGRREPERCDAFPERQLRRLFFEP